MSYFTTEKAQLLISDLIDDVWEAESPHVNEFEQYMRIGTMKRGEETNVQTAGFGMPIERDLLEDIDYDEPQVLEKQTIVPLNWGRGYRIPKETIEDIADAGPWDGYTQDRLTQYAAYTAQLKRKSFERVDLECALKWINGTSTADQYKGRESTATAMFSASHTTSSNPPITQSNVTTGSAMTATNVFTAITALDTQRDETGDFISTGRVYNLLHGPSLRKQAIEITKTTGEVGTANNTVNAVMNIPGIKIVPVEVKNFDRANGAAYTGWFVQAANDHQVWWKWRLKPVFDKNVDFDAVASKYMCRFRGVHYHKDWRGVIGYPPS